MSSPGPPPRERDRRLQGKGEQDRKTRRNHVPQRNYNSIRRDSWRQSPRFAQYARSAISFQLREGGKLYPRDGRSPYDAAFVESAFYPERLLFITVRVVLSVPRKIKKAPGRGSFYQLDEGSGTSVVPPRELTERRRAFRNNRDATRRLLLIRRRRTCD